MTVAHLPLKLINILTVYQLNTFLRIVIKLRVNCSVTFKSSFSFIRQKCFNFICLFGRKLFSKKISGRLLILVNIIKMNSRKQGSEALVQIQPFVLLLYLKNLIQTP